MSRLSIDYSKKVIITIFIFDFFINQILQWLSITNHNFDGPALRIYRIGVIIIYILLTFVNLREILIKFSNKKKLFTIIVSFIIYFFIKAIFFKVNYSYVYIYLVSFLFLLNLFPITDCNNNRIYRQSSSIVDLFVKFFKWILLINFFIVLISSINYPISSFFTFRENRIPGLFGHPVEDSGIFIAIIPFFYKNILAKKKAFYLVLIVIYLIFINGTRYAIFGFFFTLSIFQLSRTKKFNAIFFRFLIISIGIILVFPYINEYILSDGFFRNFTQMFYTGRRSGLSEGNLSERFAGIWFPGILFTIKNHLFLGSGMWQDVSGQFAINLYGTPTARDPHNFYVMFFVEQGLIGIILFISFIYMGIKHTLKQLFKKTDFFSISLLCSWISLTLFFFMFANAWPSFSIPVLIVVFLLTFYNKLEIEK